MGESNDVGYKVPPGGPKVSHVFALRPEGVAQGRRVVGRGQAEQEVVLDEFPQAPARSVRLAASRSGRLGLTCL